MTFQIHSVNKRQGQYSITKPCFQNSSIFYCPILSSRDPQVYQLGMGVPAIQLWLDRGKKCKWLGASPRDTFYSQYWYMTTCMAWSIAREESMPEHQCLDFFSGGGGCCYIDMTMWLNFISESTDIRLLKVSKLSHMIGLSGMASPTWNYQPLFILRSGMARCGLSKDIRQCTS